jgi:hypothetical protein
MTVDHDVRWQWVASYGSGGEDRWVMQGVQIGGTRSRAGIVGIWTEVCIFFSTTYYCSCLRIDADDDNRLGTKPKARASSASSFASVHRTEADNRQPLNFFSCGPFAYWPRISHPKA